MKTLVRIVLSVLVLGGGALVTWWILETQPRAEREGAVRQTPMLVEVTEARSGYFEPRIVVLGTVEPARDIHLRSRVGGEVIHRDPVFTPGGIVDAGDVLVRIDPADYENVLARRESELEQARADFDIEKGRQMIARRDLEMLDESLRPDNVALALREPQLRAARARVQSAETAVKQADLEVKRTVLAAPFDAQVLSRNTDRGTVVDAGDDLGRLVCLDEYWVVAAVPQTMLRWIEFPDGPTGKGSTVHIRNRASWPEGQERVGQVHRLVGALDESTRMARVLVVVTDPLARKKETAGLPRMIVGSVVQASIEGRALRDVIRLHRDQVRVGDTVWTMEDGKLAIRRVDIAFRDAEHAYVSAGLEPGARIVTTNLATVAAGAPLRTANAAPQEGEAR